MPDSININIGFFTHPKTVRLATLLGPGAEARLIQLWTYIATHRPVTGGFDDWTPEEIEAAARWPGEKGRFAHSLETCGWLRKQERDGKTGYFAHDWREHQPHLVKYAAVCHSRRKAAETMWEKRRKRPKGKENGDDANALQETRGACPNYPFCTGKAGQCKADQTIPPISPAEAAERVADHYAAVAKPKRLDKSGSRKVFLDTLARLVASGVREECLVAAADHYAAEVAATETDDGDVKFRHGLQTFYGPRHEHWKDYLLPPDVPKRLSNADVPAIAPELAAWAEDAAAKGLI